MQLREIQKQKMFEYGIPGYMHGAIVRYYEEGIPPGDFLTALINNDLRETFLRADDTNAQCVKSYVTWFFNQAPAGSWGHATAVENWVKQFTEAKQEPT